MASEVDISNLALAHLGDTATVSSIRPPEGSPQARLCAQFYPIARNSLLEMASWGFATKRAILAEVANTWPEWQYAYSVPAGMVNVLAVLPEDATDDYEADFPVPDQPLFPPDLRAISSPSIYTPQPYTMETDADGNQIILTNCPNAHLRFTAIVTDTTKFSPLFVLALSYLLASMLAGPLIKGETGAQIAASMMQKFQLFEAQAEASDANQRRITATPVTTWISGR